MGLRESKKIETRRLISDCAARLFQEQGFERTTIAEIAAAARVARKTVTNYFPRKEDLALDQHEEFTAELARVVAEREPGEPPLAALGRAFRTALVTHSPAAGFTGVGFARMVAESPTLGARLRELHERREEALARALADAGGGGGAAEPSGAGDVEEGPGIAARATAAMIAAADRLMFRRIQELTLAGRTDDEIEALLTPEADHVYGMLVAAVGGFPG
ncbi:TetR/AcrR family transcriptional regulator [Streptomyces antimicrobicus]|uniref:TetR family transcriptional regulator n=1 Tax=Streptomyces antimicrobicus TaxID=2883108 RepID=A0ABS8BCG7_9ACTN|nr:TetR family transcriptional regulator [Streptomyces antimicrobicus]MCB5182323.1 TetR family transcriptional regulator [Streptomyces antimicrobicus]